MKKKLVIAKMPVNGKEHIATVLYENGKAVELYFSDVEKEQVLGNIYLGHVTKAAQGGFFVNYDGVHEGFLPVRKTKGAIFKTVKNDPVIKPGDELLVMADTEAVKSKLTGLTCELSISGKNLVACSGFAGLKFSAKLGGGDKDRIKEILSDVKKSVSGFIVRTSSSEASKDELISEAKSLSEKIGNILRYGISRPYGTCLYKAGEIWIEKIKSMRPCEVEKIVTDITDIYEEIKKYLDEEQSPETALAGSLCLYDDKMVSLYRLNSLSALLDSATCEKVWLRSGASVVIQQTEAFVCIDVNSSKASSVKKAAAEEFFKINCEAAEEIAKQIRLRQLSGIILIDFINMGSKELEGRLISEFSAFVKSDPAKVNIIDITPLGIMEVTRRKKSRSLNEQIFCLTKA